MSILERLKFTTRPKEPRVLTDQREPNRPYPEGYAEWVTWMREKNGVFVSCLHIHRNKHAR